MSMHHRTLPRWNATNTWNRKLALDHSTRACTTAHNHNGPQQILLTEAWLWATAHEQAPLHTIFHGNNVANAEVHCRRRADMLRISTHDFGPWTLTFNTNKSHTPFTPTCGVANSPYRLQGACKLKGDAGFLLTLLDNVSCGAKAMRLPARNDVICIMGLLQIDQSFPAKHASQSDARLNTGGKLLQQSRCPVQKCLAISVSTGLLGTHPAFLASWAWTCCALLPTICTCLAHQWHTCGCIKFLYTWVIKHKASCKVAYPNPQLETERHCT